MANAMPVFPLVASSKVLPGVSRPRAMASRTIFAAARSFTLPPGLVHSALASNVMPSNPRTGCSNRISGVFPIRSGSEDPKRVCVLADDMREIAGRRVTVRDWECEVAFLILADWIRLMARKKRALNFQELLD